MTKHVPLHLGYTVALSITHQASKACIRVLYAGPHITRLVRRMSKLWDTKKLELLGRHCSPWHGDSSFHEDGRPSTDSQGTSLHPGWHWVSVRVIVLIVAALAPDTATFSTVTSSSSTSINFISYPTYNSNRCHTSIPHSNLAVDRRIAITLGSALRSNTLASTLSFHHRIYIWNGCKGGVGGWLWGD